MENVIDTRTALDKEKDIEKASQIKTDNGEKIDIDIEGRFAERFAERYKVIKAKFHSKKIIAYGAFVALFDSEKYALEKLNLQVALKPNFLDDFMDDDPWYIYDSKLVAYSLRLSEINQGVTEGLRQVLRLTFDEREFIITLFKFFEGGNFENLIEIIKEKILDVISDTSLVIEINFESVNTLEIPEEEIVEEVVEEKIDEYDYSHDDRERTFVAMDVIHDPINGTQISKLERGKRIYVKNLVKEEIQKYELEKTSSFKKKQYYPLFVGLRRIPKSDESGEWEAVFNFGSGFFGKTQIYPVVKVKVLNEDDLATQEAIEISQMSAPDTKESLRMYLIFLGILAIFCIVVWWYYNYGILYTLK